MRQLLHYARLFATLLLAVAWLPTPVSAIDFSKDSLDFFQGPLVNDGRVIGLGGAYVSIAEGVAGHLANPAAFAVRPASFTNDWFDWDIGFSTLAAVGGNNDLDMSGNDGKGDSALAQQVGGNLKFGRFGIGIHGVSQNNQLAVGSLPDDGAAQPRWEIDQSYVGVGLGWAFADGEWVAGVLIAAAQTTINSPRVGDPLVTFATSLHPSTFGLLWAPRGERYRLGASFRLPQRMIQRDALPLRQLGSLSLPESVQMLGQLSLGGSWMFGARQPNIRPTYGSGSYAAGTVKAKALRRRYSLVSADILLIGATHQGIGVRSYLDGRRQPAGDSVLFGMRFGAESEVLPNRLQIRTGAYFEPNRFDTSVGRMHWTAGADVRVTVFWNWRINLLVDVAPEYRNISLGIGLWH